MTATIQRHDLPRTAAATTPGRLDPMITGLAPAAWGLTYIVTTELLPPGRPLLAAALRALPAGLALAAITRRRPTGSWWWKAAVLACSTSACSSSCCSSPPTDSPAVSLPPSAPSNHWSPPGWRQRSWANDCAARSWPAGMLGVVGVGLLVLRSGAAVDTVGVLAGLAGALSMASGVVLTKHWGRPVPLAAFTSWQLIAGGVLLAPIALAVEGPPPSLTGQNLIGFTWLATAGAAASYLISFRGVARLPVAQVSLLGLISPIVATVAGLVVLHQTLTPAQLLGAALILTAILGSVNDPLRLTTTTPQHHPSHHPSRRRTSHDHPDPHPPSRPRGHGSDITSALSTAEPPACCT